VTEIVDGELVLSELTQNSNGGTEQMARRIVRDIPQELLKGKQIIFSRINKLEPNLKKIFYAHDLANDPEVAVLADSDFRSQLDKIVFVSNWQQHTYNMVLGIPFAESHVIRNGIEIEPFTDKDYSGKINLIYHTTPHRGLAIVTAVFEELSKRFDVHLDVFSSFAAYGWNDRDNDYKLIFDKLKTMDNVDYHGFQPNSTVREALKRSHLFMFPSIWPETSCLALIEAMCFGNFTVHSNLGALPETSISLTDCYVYDEDIQRHANKFYRRMVQALKWIDENREVANESNKMISRVANGYYDWNNIKSEWVDFLRQV